MTTTSAPAARYVAGAAVPAAPFAQSTTMRRPSSRFGRVAINRWTYQSAPPSRSATTRPIDAPAGPGPVAVASRSSMASSVALASLVPPGPKNLSPLSGIGLWLAEIITPNAGAGLPTWDTALAVATAGVG